MQTQRWFYRFQAAVAVVMVSAVSVPAAESGPTIISGFVSPETVVHDELTDLYLVSNVGGSPVAVNHGFISRVNPDGSVLDLRWIQDGVGGVTLHGPKGMWLQGRDLFVADVDTLRVFNRFTGAPERDVPIPNPFAPATLFLNHIVGTREGVLYISDQINSAIFKVDREGNASVLAAGPELGGPDGLLLDGGELTWVTFFGHEVRRMTRSGNIIMEAALPAADVTGLTLGPNPLPPGTLLLDGYTRNNGYLLVSSWVTGKIYKIGRSGSDVVTTTKVISMIDNPAAPDGPAKIEMDRMRNRLLIPLFNAGQLMILPIED
jgi:hypothetical protein